MMLFFDFTWPLHGIFFFNISFFIVIIFKIISISSSVQNSESICFNKPYFPQRHLSNEPQICTLLTYLAGWNHTFMFKVIIYNCLILHKMEDCVYYDPKNILELSLFSRRFWISWLYLALITNPWCSQYSQTNKMEVKIKLKWFIWCAS